MERRPAPVRAVVGAGAWGTTLAVMLGRTGPVTLLARTAEAAGAIALARENIAHLPGVPLPDAVRVTADEGRVAAARELVVMAVPAGAHACGGGAHLLDAPAGHHRRLGRQGDRARQPAPDEPGAVCGAAHRPRPGLCAVGPQSRGRDRGRAARERGGGVPWTTRLAPGSWRCSEVGRSGCIATGTWSAWRWPARSRTSWPSPPVPRTRSAWATTARPRSSRGAWRR